jgi:hypothetical protein
MSKSIRKKLSMGVLLFFALAAYSQTSPCPAGTMADVLGTSCSVGPVIFNFQAELSGSFAVFGVQSGSISPADIGFIPVQEDGRAGFKLLLNFIDETAPGGFHVLNFAYTPQAAAGFEIRRQALSIDAAATSAPSGFALVEAFDNQSYPNSGFVGSQDFLINFDGVTTSNQISNEEFLKVPGLFSIGSGFSDITTTIETLASGPASDALRSATILYTFGPVVPVPPPLALKYTNIDLPGTFTTFVSNIINSGRTVGSYTDFSGVFHGYVAEPNGTFATIDVPGAIATFGLGLNEHGDIVGTYTDATRQTHGFLQRNGAITVIDVPQGTFTAPIVINDKGQIAGFYETPDAGFHGFLLDQGVFTTLDHGPGTKGFALTEAFALNNEGMVGGEFFNPVTFRSFLQRGTESENVDVPGQGDTIIDGINNQGDAVGTFDDFNLVQHGFLRTGSSFQTVDHPEGTFTFPLGINSSGKIVGTYTDVTGQVHSFIAEPAGADDLSQSGPTASIALQSSERPDCRNEDWQRKRGQLRNAGSCQLQH